MSRARCKSRAIRNSLGALALTTAVAAPFAGADPVTYRIDPEFTSTAFSVGQLGGLSEQRGHFGRTVGLIVIDPDWHTGSIEMEVDATSVDTGWGLRDAFLKGEDMFDTERYPRVRFRSTQLTFNGARLIGIAGELSMHNVTRLIELKIVRLDCGSIAVDGRDGCGGEAVTSLRRSDFGMTYALGLIADQIDLSFQVTAFRVPAAEQAQAPHP
jgi:polyisoprenoid-binding protein YceI